VDPEGTGDAWGSATHSAQNGASISRLQQTADLNVDNAEFDGWVSDTGITEQMIRAGYFDYAKWKVYRLNYMDLSQGHELVASGTCGETTFSRNGWSTEFRSLMQQMKQPLSRLYSLTCTKRFGSKPIGTGGEQPEERHPCGVDWVWVPYTVTSVDVADPRRIFTASAMVEADHHFAPGVVRWLTGDNAGAEMDVEDNVADEVTMILPVAYPVVIGDTYEIRQDCNKIGRLGDCKLKHDNYVQFGGQEDIPIADGAILMVPGAAIRR
jgi:uncharacterized phage protein (TIGR02218 family)